MDKLTETLLYIAAIIAFSIFSGWMKKKAQKQEEQGGPGEEHPEPRHSSTTPASPGPQTPRTPPRPIRPMNWEEELRRLLEGDEAEPAPPPRPRPPVPPVVVPVPSPSVPASPSPVPERPLFQPYHAPAPMRTPALASEPPLAKLVHSTEAYQNAHQLQVTVAEKLAKVAELKKLQASAAPPRRHSADAQAARNLLRQPTTLRQAMMASVILGPPKALETTG